MIREALGAVATVIALVVLILVPLESLVLSFQWLMAVLLLLVVSAWGLS